MYCFLSTPNGDLNLNEGWTEIPRFFYYTSNELKSRVPQETFIKYVLLQAFDEITPFSVFLLHCKNINIAVSNNVNMNFRKQPF